MDENSEPCAVGHDRIGVDECYASGCQNSGDRRGDRHRNLAFGGAAYPKSASRSGKIPKFFQLHSWDAKLLRLTYLPILRAFLLGRKELTAFF